MRADKILLPTASVSSNVNVSANRQSVISMSTIASDTGRSKLAKSPRPNDHRVNALKRGSIRSMQGSLNHPYGHNYSASDGRLSPTPSYSPSFNDSTAGFAATIGFASNLSHAVIREHDDETHSVDSRHTTSTVDDDLNDDELALYGAPWAKEGMLWKRNAEDPSVKKTTKKDWKQFFVVVQRGELLFFTFGAGSGSGSGSFGVGGGNWLVSGPSKVHFAHVPEQRKQCRTLFSCAHLFGDHAGGILSRPSLRLHRHLPLNPDALPRSGNRRPGR